jgi:hypothetical protein
MRFGCWWLTLMGLWMLLADNIHGDEIVTGAVVATAGATVAIVAWDRMAGGVGMPRGVAAGALRAGWRLVPDSWLLLRALWQTVVRRRPVRGRWVTEPIDDADTPAARGERVWAVLCGSVAPNRIVGDADRGRLVVHELVRR